jgi:hypothetical protein
MFDFVGDLAANAAALRPLMLIIVALVLVGVVLRFVCHTIADMPRSACACMAILVLYLLAELGLGGGLGALLRLLPFLGEASGSGDLYTLLVTDFPTFFVELSRLFVLACVVNLSQDLLIRKGRRNLMLWLVLEGLTLVEALVVNWGVEQLIRTYLPHGYANWLPVVVICVVAVLLLLAVLKLIFQLVNPILGLILGFFSGNPAGRTLTKSTMTTLLLALVVLIAHRMGYGGILLSSTLGLETLLPLALVILMIWYFVWRILC